MTTTSQMPERDALKPPKKIASVHEPEHVNDPDTPSRAPEGNRAPDPTGEPNRGIDPPARKPEPKLVTEAVESVVEWHRQRATAQATSRAASGAASGATPA